MDSAEVIPVGQFQVGSPAKAGGVEVPEVGQARNYFRLLLPDAFEQMRRIMQTNDDDKVVAGIAKDVIELAGEGAQQKGASVVVINDSDVKLLLNVTQEVLGGAR
jgi:hypothetical protein